MGKIINEVKNFIRLIINRKLLSNVNKSSHSKKVLVSYITSPFLHDLQNHTNVLEGRVIAKIFDKIGYSVDVINYDSSRIIDYSKYSVIFGFGEPFESSFASQAQLVRIYYATGAHVVHQNLAEINRVIDVNKKRHTSLLPSRVVPWNWSLSVSLSDALIVIGNTWTLSTYKKYSDAPMYSINATALTNNSLSRVIEDKERKKRSFLWFGSRGSIHKGLDLCVELFKMRPDLVLHICGPKEDDFFEIFNCELESENIHFHGFVDVKSEKFVEIVSKCSFSVLPTCSEGQATSLLTTMGRGLIPISTIYSGVDVDKHGYLIERLSTSSLEESINNAISLTQDEITEKAKEINNYINQCHSIPAFEDKLDFILRDILSEI